MNMMEINKIAAAVLTAGVIAMMLGLFARILIPAHDGHGDAGPNLFADLAPPAARDTAPAGPEPIEGFLAAATVEAGMRVANKCIACHSFEVGGPNKVGPNLANMVGQEIGGKEYAYSNVFQGMDGTWGYEELSQFLYKPRDFAPGTKMTFVGLNSPEERAAIIVYMRSVTENPPPLPE